jgi:hypothetical protein
LVCISGRVLSPLWLATSLVAASSAVSNWF